MIFETRNTFTGNPLLSQSPLILDALKFAFKLEIGHPTGRFDLKGDDCFALVQDRETFYRDERMDVEAHQEYADLQYCFGGGEIIDWYPRNLLAPTGEYQEEEDFQLFKRPLLAPVPLAMLPGSFALLFPEDGHVPAINDGVNDRCQMVVFKIRVSALLEYQSIESVRPI